jgi:DNA-binding MarR family transcriptional regulator
MPAKALGKKDFETLSEFRYRLRRFLRFSEQVTRKNGITPLQYLLLMHIKGFPGREWATVGELAERLQAQHHGVVALISRCEKLGWVERRQDQADRREVTVHLTPDGQFMAEKMVRLHRDELLSPAISALVPDLRNLHGD